MTGSNMHTHIILTFTHTHNNCGGLIHLLGLSLTHTNVHIVCMILRTVLTHGEMQHSLKLPAILTFITATVTNMFKRE